MADTLTAVEVVAESTVAVSRVVKLSGYRAVTVAAVECVDDETVTAEVSFAADRLTDLRRLHAEMGEAIAWLESEKDAKPARVSVAVRRKADG